MSNDEQEFARQIVRNNRYLTLASCDGAEPWAATLEYVCDEDLNLYFFSPEASLHARHIQANERVALSIFEAQQQEFEPAEILRLAGVQIEAVAHIMSPPYPDLIERQIEIWQLSLPPYAAYRITPQRWYLPVVKDGVNVRIDVGMD